MVLGPYDRARVADGGRRAAVGVRPADAGTAARAAAALAARIDPVGRAAGAAPRLAGPDRPAAGLDRAHAGALGLARAGAVRGGAARSHGPCVPAPYLSCCRPHLLVVAGRQP